MIHQIFTMKKMLFLFACVIALAPANAQYKNDNVLYKTVFPQYLCKTLQNTSEYLLLDVRSNPEFEDSVSSSAKYNLGHLKNAQNINVQELASRLKEIEAYKDKPVFVYCSHSQRSRRASKMLADSGFTNVINVNGGITGIRQLPADNCIYDNLTTNVGYQIISAASLCKKISNGGNDFFILDVRSNSAWQNISTDAKLNAFGHFKNSIHIPLTLIQSSLSQIPKNKEIIVVDISGDDASQAAGILVKNNYKNIAVLLEGIDRYFSTDSKLLNCSEGSFVSAVKYRIISSADFKRFAEDNTGYLTIDLRPADEFLNNDKDSWKNIGHIKNAVNISAEHLINNIESIKMYKYKPVVLYAFSGSSNVYEAANLLTAKGFTNVIVLNGGLFNLRWTAANVEGNDSFAKMIEDVPQENL